MDIATGAECLAPLGSSSRDGYEALYCAKGHRVRIWYVLDAEGRKMALAKLNSGPEILDAMMLAKLSEDPKYKNIPYAINKTCQRGHDDWYLAADNRYRCRICKRDREREREEAEVVAYDKAGEKDRAAYEKAKVRNRERYHKKAAAAGKQTKRRTVKLDPEEIRKRNSTRVRERYKSDPKFRKAHLKACKRWREKSKKK
jgi:hypothetical protein